MARIELRCSATNCHEQLPGNDRCTLSSLRYSASVEGWRHDRVGELVRDWCPWHSPEQEQTARQLLAG